MRRERRVVPFFFFCRAHLHRPRQRFETPQDFARKAVPTPTTSPFGMQLLAFLREYKVSERNPRRRRTFFICVVVVDV
jgi:hypothetical protein